VSQKNAQTLKQFSSKLYASILTLIGNILIYCVSKKCANFETVQVKIIRIDFDDIWQKCSKYSKIQFACFSFCVGLLFLSTFRLSNRIPKIMQNYASHYLSTWRHWVKTKFWSKAYECKGYNAQQFTTEFPDKGWTNNSNRLLVKLRKFRTMWRAIVVTSGDAI